MERMNERTGFEIAVIGMAGRFPGAGDINSYWENLKNGVESITFLADEELKEAKISEELLENPNYVKTKGGVLEGIEYFDAPFFGYTPGEAKAMDPQVRILHECAWTALEDAGYAPGTYEGSIGIFAGAAPHLEWELLYLLSGNSDQIGDFEAHHFVNRDSLCTAISYKLNLKGPAVLVQTACSTSLVAIHTACRSLLSGECDMALAGGVAVSSRSKTGFIYQEGMVLSPDGHCRAFDAEAKGSAGGQGAGIVVLKPLEDAIDDRDHIYAVIKGSAVNNDGLRRIGYTAPGIEGQAEVIRTALHMAELPPASITYIEAHGTGTPLGDPIEIEALRQAFDTNKKGYCAVGSVKTNIGHLNTAAGVAGFIKTVLALKHRLIPPSLFFNTPNPKIDFENSPFYVNTELKEWKNNAYPLRAGVSSFGIGGTNAHVVLEEWSENKIPKIKDQSQRLIPEGAGGLAPLPGSTSHHLILLSAKTQTALDRAAENLTEFLKQHPTVNMEDVAYTLQVGRKTFPYKKKLLCSTVEEAVEILSQSTTSGESRKVQTFLSKEEDRPIVFMFPGLGAQHVNMGLDLYRHETFFRKEMDTCFDLLKELSGMDVKDILYPSPGNPLPDQEPGEHSDRMNQIEISQLVVFIFEYALARLLMKWGIRPYALIGYSFGEYTAACLSGVVSPRDTLKMILIRGELLRQVHPGRMLSVPLPVEELEPLLDETLSIAIDNGPSCVVSGPNEAVEAFEKQLKKKRLMCMQMSASRAIHSRMMNPISNRFREKIEDIVFNKPGIPYISNVTGDWMTDKAAADPGYWATHLKETVRFVDGMKKLLDNKKALFVEVGPGRDLKALALRLIDKEPETRLVTLVKDPGQKVSDTFYLLNRIGQLWLYGKVIDWSEFHSGEERHRISLPTYPFEHRRYWYEGDPLQRGFEILQEKASLHKRPNISDWFYVPSWKRSPLTGFTGCKIPVPPVTLVFTSDYGPGLLLAQRLEQAGGDVVVVKAGNTYKKENDSLYTISPGEYEHYEQLVSHLHKSKRVPNAIVHLWNVTANPHLLPEEVETVQDLGFYSLLNIAKALGHLVITEAIRMIVVTNHMQAVLGVEDICPLKSTILGPVKVIPLEYPNITCRSIDILFPEPHSIVDRLVMELAEESTVQVAAYRGRHRWVQTYEPTAMEASHEGNMRLKEGGVYLITGGTGGIGLVLAEYLAQSVRAKLVLTGRSFFPPRDRWQEWLDTHEKEDRISRKIEKVKNLEKSGAEVLVLCADVTDTEQMQQVIHQTNRQFGPINGVIHSAGLADGAVIQLRTREKTDRVLAPKVKGTLVLDRMLEDQKLDFFLFCSSLGSVLTGPGQAGYCAANAFLDAFAHYKNAKNGGFTVSVDWDTWREVGMALEVANQHSLSFLEHAISPGEGAAVFKRIMDNHQPQVLVSTRDLNLILQHWNTPQNDDSALVEEEEEKRSDETLNRPLLSSEYAAPTNQIEVTLAEIFQKFFGYEQVGVDDDFFDLGGDSLKAMTVAANIHKELNVKIALEKIFKIPTIRGLAAYIKETKEKNKEDKYQRIEPVEKKEYYPVTSAQKRLYILQQMTPESTGYHMPQALMIESYFDKDKLESIFKQLVRRHESFRTSFHMLGEVPVQRVHDTVDFQIKYYCPGIRGQESGGREKPMFSSPDEIIKNFIRPFDLSRAPLLRVGLVNAGENEHILIVDMHHIVTDGLSKDILTREFLVLYAGEPLPRLVLQYKDFAQWQNSSDQRTSIKNQLVYWQELFQEEPPALNLPIDYPRPPVQQFDGGSYYFDLDKAGTDALKKLAADSDATLFMVLMGVLNVFLSRLGGQQDIVVGTPIAGRRQTELEPIIGMFVNTLAMRNFPSTIKTFHAFLKEVKERTLEIFENQEYQFEDLVDSVSVRRDLSRNPLFDVMFTYRNITGDGPGTVPVDLTLRPYTTGMIVSNFDMTLNAVEVEDRLSFSIEYCSKLFKPDTMDRFAGYFKQIVSAVGENSEVRIADMDIIPEREKEQILYTFNDTDVEYPRDKTIHALFEEQVEKTPDKAALVGSWQLAVGKEVSPTAGKEDKIGETVQLTYGELNEKSCQLARLLRAKGATSEVIVGIKTDRSIHMIIGIMAILKTGAAYLPIDPGYPEERIHYMLADSAANILLASSDYISEGPGKQGGLAPLYLPLDDHLTACTTQLAANPADPTSLAYVIYTSGSTGKPKGVMIQHQSVVNFIKGITDIIPFNERDSILSLTTISFDIFGLETLLPLTRGSKVVIGSEEEQLNNDSIASAIKRENITIFQVTPSRLQLLLGDAEASKSLKLLEYLLVGGEALPTLLLEKVRDLVKGKIYNLYGPTETTIWSAVKDVSGDEPLNIGKPIANTRIYILDQWDHIQPIGVAGELYIAGDGLSRGYINRPQLTAEKFNQDFQDEKEKVVGSHHSSFITHHSPLYRTGDLACWLSDGNIEFLGRMDNQVKVRGFRIELGEIETQLVQHPRIKDAVVIAREESSGGKSLCAYTVAPAGCEETPDIAEIRQYLSHTLPDYMIPSYVMQLETIPLTPNGKVNRKALPQPIAASIETYVAPSNKVEEQLAGIWSELLDIETIGVNDNFFDMGGDSLKAITVASNIHKELNVKIALQKIFKSPTIRGLAAYIKEVKEENKEDKYQRIEPAEKKEYYPLTSSQKRLYVLQQLNVSSINYNMPQILDLDEELDKIKLEATFKKLIKRHESLRTSFKAVDGEPTQQVHDNVSFEIDYYDISDDNGRVSASIIQDFIRPFDLSHVSLLRVGIIKEKEKKYILMVDMHHIISDDISGEVLKKDFMALLSGQELPHLEIQYKDYCQWYNSKGQREALKKQEEYWIKEFEGEIPMLNLPIDYERPAVQSFEGCTVNFVIGERETGKLKKCALEEGVTLYMILLTIYTIFLSRITGGQEDIVVGTGTAGRKHANLREIIGMFVNTLALRNYPEGEKTFKAFLKEVKERTLAAFENEDYPFEELVERVLPHRYWGRNPLVEAVLVLLNAVNRPGEIPGTETPETEAELFKNETGTSKFDITLYGIEIGGRLFFAFEYCTKLFKKETIQRFIDYFKDIAAAVMENKDIKLKDIPIAHDFLEAKLDVYQDELEGFDFQ
jgi:amino acid adenylation domain-containing protein